MNTIEGTGVKDGSSANAYNSSTLAAHRSEALLAFDVATKHRA